MTPAAINEAFHLLNHKHALQRLLSDCSSSELVVDGPAIGYLMNEHPTQFIPDFAACLEPVKAAYLEARNAEFERCIARIEERLNHLGVKPRSA